MKFFFGDSQNTLAQMGPTGITYGQAYGILKGEQRSFNVGGSCAADLARQVYPNRNADGFFLMCGTNDTRVYAEDPVSQASLDMFSTIIANYACVLGNDILPARQWTHTWKTTFNVDGGAFSDNNIMYNTPGIGPAASVAFTGSLDLGYYLFDGNPSSFDLNLDGSFFGTFPCQTSRPIRTALGLYYCPALIHIDLLGQQRLDIIPNCVNSYPIIIDWIATRSNGKPVSFIAAPHSTTPGNNARIDLYNGRLPNRIDVAIDPSDLCPDGVHLASIGSVKIANLL